MGRAARRGRRVEAAVLMRARAAAAVLASLFAACSLVNDPDAHTGRAAPGTDAGPGVDGGPGADAGPVPIAGADFCRELVVLFCEARIACCAAAAGEDFDDCRTERMTSCQSAVGPFVEDGRTGYDEERAGEMIAEGRRLYRDGCNLGVVDWLAFGNPDGLLSVFEGTAPMGVGCSFIDASFLSCRQPLVCRGNLLFPRCQPTLADGTEPCMNQDWACGPDSHCPGVEPATCAPRLADGEPCAEGADCESLVCGMASMICEPRTPDVYCQDPFAQFRRD